tara:strand:+ start:628 stop:750 length:123 start_codon:yes stop_codon:yes gene_type:complete
MDRHGSSLFAAPWMSRISVADFQAEMLGELSLGPGANSLL